MSAARAQLEYVEEKYSIPRVHFGRVVGKKFQNIRDLELKSKCRIKPWEERDRKFGGTGARVKPPKKKNNKRGGDDRNNNNSNSNGGDDKNNKTTEEDDDGMDDSVELVDLVRIELILI